jgi:hypothetical protein
VRAFGGDKPYWLFPTAISMRANPYGAAPAENPNNVRQAMNRVDPRERGLIGAAWYAGYFARAAAAGVDAVTLGAVAGPSGIVYTPLPHAQAFFDEADAVVYPNFHVIAGHAALAGKVHKVDIDDAGSVQALAVSNDDGTTVWVANLTGDPQTVVLSGLSGSADVLVLDETTFEAACRDPGWRETADRQSAGPEPLTLAPYAVAELRYR